MNNNDILKDLSHIRNLMEKSTKFISISGLSGVLMGVYTLAALSFLFYKLNITMGSFGSGSTLVSFSEISTSEARKVYILTAIILLILSLATGVILAKRKADKNGQNIWNATSKALLLTVSGPLITGGLFVIIGAINQVYEIIIPSFLTFYGLALFSGGAFTFKEIRVLGVLQIILGLLAFMYSNFGLLFFGLGFGVLHIVYGILILKKHGA